MKNTNDEYHYMLHEVLNFGEIQPPSRGQEYGTKEIFGRDMQMQFNLTNGLPIVSTKKVWLKGIIHELVWFLRGNTNIMYLVDNEVHIWDDNAYDYYKKVCQTNMAMQLPMNEFLERVGFQAIGDYIFGDLGPVYGAQWERQLPGIVKRLKESKDSRQILLNTWNSDEIKDMALPPCHSVPVHFRVFGEYLDVFMYQRSADLFLGVPFNITSTALLVTIIAKSVGLKPRYLTHQLGSAHIYLNHIEQVKEQLTRSTDKYPSYFPVQVTIPEDLTQMQYKDIQVKGYQSYPAIKGEMVV